MSEEKWRKGMSVLAVSVGDFSGGAVEHEVTAHILGPLAVHREVTHGLGEGKKWDISQVSTGLKAVGGYRRLADAKAAAEKLLDGGGKDWNKGRWGTVRGMGAACKRLQAIRGEVAPWAASGR